MAKPKNYEALIEAKKEQIAKAEEKMTALKRELKELEEEQREAEVSSLYEAVKRSGMSVQEVLELLDGQDS